jgi:hypothetical protein
MKRNNVESSVWEMQRIIEIISRFLPGLAFTLPRFPLAASAG